MVVGAGVDGLGEGVAGDDLEDGAGLSGKEGAPEPTSLEGGAAEAFLDAGGAADDVVRGDVGGDFGKGRSGKEVDVFARGGGILHLGAERAVHAEDGEGGIWVEAAPGAQEEVDAFFGGEASVEEDFRWAFIFGGRRFGV